MNFVGTSATKTVTIIIDKADLDPLQHNTYNICFAKKVDSESYNVVWQSSSKYLATNTFSWEPQYQLFGTKFFSESVEVEVATNVVNIGLGQTVP
jgi:hypothetical protein